MQIIHNLRQILLRFILTCHVRELDSLRRLYVYFGIRLAHTEHHRVPAATGFVHQTLIHKLADYHENGDRHNPAQQCA